MVDQGPRATPEEIGISPEEEAVRNFLHNSDLKKFVNLRIRLATRFGSDEEGERKLDAYLGIAARVIVNLAAAVSKKIDQEELSRQLTQVGIAAGLSTVEIGHAKITGSTSYHDWHKHKLSVQWQRQEAVKPYIKIGKDSRDPNLFMGDNSYRKGPSERN